MAKRVTGRGESRTMHMMIAVTWPAQMAESGMDVAGWLRDGDGNPCTAQEVLDYCAELEAAGYVAIPSCDDTDEKGQCKGHKPS